MKKIVDKMTQENYIAFRKVYFILFAQENSKRNEYVVRKKL